MTSNEIKTIRTGRGMTQLDFAIALGVTPETVNRWERDKATPHKTFQRAIKKMKARTHV